MWLFLRSSEWVQKSCAYLSRGPSSLFLLSAGLTAAEPLWLTHKCWFDPIPASLAGLWRLQRAEIKSPGSAPHLALGKQLLGFWSKALVSSEIVSGFPPCCWDPAATQAMRLGQLLQTSKARKAGACGAHS